MLYSSFSTSTTGRIRQSLWKRLCNWTISKFTSARCLKYWHIMSSSRHQNWFLELLKKCNSFFFLNSLDFNRIKIWGLSLHAQCQWLSVSLPATECDCKDLLEKSFMVNKTKIELFGDKKEGLRILNPRRFYQLSNMVVVASFWGSAAELTLSATADNGLDVPVGQWFPNTCPNWFWNGYSTLTLDPVSKCKFS